MSEYTDADSRSTQMNRKIKPLRREELDRILGNGEMYRRFEKYVTVGRTSMEGPMAPEAALEEAIEDVFGGGRTRGYRRFQGHATEANINRMKSFRKGAAEVNEIYLGDEVAVRMKLRKIDDPTQLAQMLVAEYQGRNDTNEPRPSVIRLIQARMNETERPVVEEGVATDEQLKAAMADD
jgi:hypothetical protein